MDEPPADGSICSLNAMSLQRIGDPRCSMQQFRLPLLPHPLFGCFLFGLLVELYYSFIDTHVLPPSSSPKIPVLRVWTTGDPSVISSGRFLDEEANRQRIERERRTRVSDRRSLTPRRGSGRSRVAEAEASCKHCANNGRGHMGMIMDTEMPSRSSGLIRRTAVDSCGCGHSPENRMAPRHVIVVRPEVTKPTLSWMDAGGLHWTVASWSTRYRQRPCTYLSAFETKNPSARIARRHHGTSGS
jgi:hypothetical protein